MINKKILKLASCVLAIVFSMTAVNVYATNKVSAYQERTEWSVSGKYPVTPESPEWASMSYTECLKLCEMPETMLKNCSTEELSEYVLEYPLLADILAFGNAEQAIEHLSDTSNICREFFSRDGAAEILLEKYDLLNVDYKLLSNNCSDRPMTESGYTKELFLQTFFACNLQKLDSHNTEVLKQILSNKHETKKRNLPRIYNKFDFL